MAEIQESGNKKGGKNKQKKMTVRVDFTPMVDMNMLLITFFMLCTSLSKPQTMEISMPSNDKNITEEQQTKEPLNPKIIQVYTSVGNILQQYLLLLAFTLATAPASFPRRSRSSRRSATGRRSSSRSRLIARFSGSPSRTSGLPRPPSPPRVSSPPTSTRSSPSASTPRCCSPRFWTTSIVTSPPSRAQSRLESSTTTSTRR